MRLGRRREKDVKKLMLEHQQKVTMCLAEMEKAIKAYLGDNIDSAKTYALEVHKTESEADTIRRRIARELYEGAFLPLHREDFLNLVEAMDKVADAAESCCDFLLLQRPEIPKEFGPKFAEITKKSIDCFQPLMQAYATLYEDFSTTLERIHQVNLEEEEVDREEWELARIIFKGNLELAHKMLLRELIEKITTISDKAEDASDKLEILLIKRRI